MGNYGFISIDTTHGGVLVAADSTLFRFDADGNQVWSVSGSSNIEIVAESGGVVIYSEQSTHTLVGLDNTGASESQIWSTSVADDAVCAASGGGYFWVGSEGGHVWKVDPADGTVAAADSVPGHVHSIDVDPSTQRVYALREPGDSSILHQFDLSLSQVATYDAGYPPGWGISTASGGGGLCYYDWTNNRLRAVDDEALVEIWNRNLPGDASQLPQLTEVDRYGHVYVVTYDSPDSSNVIRRYDPSGELVWEAQAKDSGGSILSPQAVAVSDDDGVVYLYASGSVVKMLQL
ncbi:MAG: PQQ-binding-like beta-propeller repeat protein [Trueperaceae bacterium]|nr:PQQ-binding-like beta-propeller repeat protein [Trueperaceae bacterium]